MQAEARKAFLAFLEYKKQGANREVLEGILWVLRTGARWQDLPDRYPSPSSCWRRLRLWEEQGVWLDVWRKFLSMLGEKGALDWQEAFIDGSFAPAKKKGHFLPIKVTTVIHFVSV